MFASFGFFFFIIFFGAASAALSEKCTETMLDVKNRDEVKPTFPLLKDDPRLKPSNIVKAHKILRDGLQKFLEFREDDLGFYLNHIVVNKPPLKDEYGQEIRSYFKVFKFIWVQFNETLCQNYAIKQYDLDKLDLCSVARFLSHQSAVGDRGSIMKRMGDALGYKCHPCTPYKRKEHGGTVVPNTDDISLIESLSLEQILVLCQDYDHRGQKIMVSSTAPSYTISTFTTKPTTITKTPTTKAPEVIESVKTTHSPLNYTPCNYSSGDVECDTVSLEEVQKVFKRTSLTILASVNVTLQPYVVSKTLIPENVFGTKRILNIVIQYPFQETVNRSLSLQVHAEAFGSTKNYTEIFTINNIDCNKLDLVFFTGFDQLIMLMFANIYNIQYCLPSLPPLPRLTTLYFRHCVGMNELNIFPTLTNGLKNVKFNGHVNEIDTILNDETADRIMDWLLLSSSDTLDEMTIVEMNQVTRVPHNIASFKFLKKLWLYGNNISFIKSGAFTFSVPVTLLNIGSNGIREIDPGAFQGDFKDATVYLHNNKLTRFDESVFGPILRQMASGIGYINGTYENGNPIDCSEESICHLAWLTNYEAGVKFRLNCSNGTSFQDLQPAGFNHCQMEYSETTVSNTDDISPNENLSVDYTPCSISIDYVFCDEVPLVEVKKVFKRTSLDRLASVKMTIQPFIISERIIPEDLFGTKEILDIQIKYPLYSAANKMQIDANAFRSTKSYTNKFHIDNIDCKLFDLKFLLGFDKLASLEFYNIDNIQNCLPSLPPLPQLRRLEFLGCTGMNHLNIFPNLITNKLKEVSFYGGIHNDETVDRILDWLLLSSANTLEYLTMEYMNQLTRVPHKIASFKALTSLNLNGNKISSIKSGELSFYSPVTELYLEKNELKEIEPGAFQGDFKHAKVYVGKNHLTRFEESVFGPMLQQMASGYFGNWIDGDGNPIDCSEESICHLSWLKEYEADFCYSLALWRCSNGTSFQDLELSDCIFTN